MKLTSKQRDAAHATGSVVVTAGAGTGKTAMLAERFLYHVTADHLRPIEIVAVTFTEKAAAELRQRIRKTLSSSIDDENISAEVDAAQISTIHALAARVCREFFHLVGISPDFKILLETDSAIWLAENFDQAMGVIDESIIRELGYSWLKRMIGLLLQDPHLAAAAFQHDAESWERSIDGERENALAWLLSSDAWKDAATVCRSLSGKAGDKLETARCDAINAMSNIESAVDIRSALSVIRRLPVHHGQKLAWPPGHIDQMRAALRALKQATAEDGPAAGASLFFGPEDKALAEKVKLLKLAFTSVHQYLQIKKSEDDVLDFIDLEIFATRILQNENARRHYAKRWKAFLIDEFQDTNPLQAEMIELLRGDAKVTIVGDEKQSIYSFRRADVEVFRKVRETLLRSGGEVVELSETFRSHQALVSLVNRTFEPVLGELHAPLNAVRLEAPHPERSLSLAMLPDKKLAPDTARIVEARYITDKIRDLLERGVNVHDKQTDEFRPVRPQDVAVLSRTWAAIDIYIDALSAAGIPAVNAGGGNLLDTREAKDARAMLNFLSDIGDDVSLVAVLRSPFFAVSDRTLFQVARGKPRDETWWQAIQRSPELSGARDVLASLLKQRHEFAPEDLLRRADAATGYSSVIANLPQGDRREADWNGFLSHLTKLGADGRSDLFGVMRRLKAFIDVKGVIPRPPVDAGDSVSLMTIHYAKGLEWPVVFVPDLAVQTKGWGDGLLIDGDLGIAFEIEDGEDNKSKPAIYDLIRNKSRAREREEEKRLLYVAVTRARDQVFLTSGPEKGGTMIELLMPGIEAAQIPTDEIPISDELCIPPMPGDPPPFETPEFINIEPVNIGLRTVAISGLDDYALCPLKFKYIYVDGHPGLGEGSAQARLIGTLTHKALELNIDSPDVLQKFAADEPAESVLEALDLARRFREDEAFVSFQDPDLLKEQAVILKQGAVDLVGVADLVGPEFVLDYKTDTDAKPALHRFQLWAYAKALAKPSALIAYLRQGNVVEFSAEQLLDVELDAERLIEGIASGRFDPAPAPEKCRRCVYSPICRFSAADNVPTVQLDLFPLT